MAVEQSDLCSEGRDAYRNLTLSVEASGNDLTVTCSLDSFDIDLEVLVLQFERVQFRSRAARSPRSTQVREVRVCRPAFIHRDAAPGHPARRLRPARGSVTAEGITAGFSMGLPNLSFGVFSLENLSLGASRCPSSGRR